MHIWDEWGSEESLPIYLSSKIWRRNLPLLSLFFFDSNHFPLYISFIHWSLPLFSFPQSWVLNFQLDECIYFSLNMIFVYLRLNASILVMESLLHKVHCSRMYTRQVKHAAFVTAITSSCSSFWKTKSCFCIFSLFFFLQKYFHFFISFFIFM